MKMIRIDIPMTRLFLIGLTCLMLAVSISACGKRGEPYRPSEVSTTS